MLGRFAQPDTIVPEPGDPQALNRYSYVLNNPIRYTDPSGHAQICADGDEGGGCGYGANTSQIWQAFARKDSALVEYYAALHRLTLAQASGASAVEVEALAGAVDTAYSAGSAWLPQHQFDPTVVIEPASLVSIGGAVTSGGGRVLGGIVAGINREMGDRSLGFGGGILAADEKLVVFESTRGSGRIKTYDPDGQSAQSLAVTGSPEQAYQDAFGRSPTAGEPYWQTTAGQIASTGRFAYLDAVGSPGHVSIYGGAYRNPIEFVKIWTRHVFGP